MQRLDPRVRLVWGLVVLLGGLVVGGVITGALAVFTDRGGWPGLAIGGLVFLAGLAYALARYRIWRFDVQEDALYLERGVFTRVRTVVPYVRIQHIDTQRNPVERVFGLGRVVVYTAGSRGADVAIPGLTPDRASDLQHRLRRLVGESDSEDAV